MASIRKTQSGTWKAIIRRKGYPQTIKTFTKKRDAQDWARRIEDEMARGIYFRRTGAEQMTLSEALDRYLKEITAHKKPSTAKNEQGRARTLKAHLGEYAMAAISPVVLGKYRDIHHS